MNDIEMKREIRRQNRLERLGTSEPRCGICGESDDRVHELHHVAGRKHDDLTVIHCRNCHRKVSDDQLDHPAFDPNADPVLANIGHFLMGLADMLRIIIGKLQEFGEALIERSTQFAGDAK